jgi:hypothetical protein
VLKLLGDAWIFRLGVAGEGVGRRGGAENTQGKWIVPSIVGLSLRLCALAVVSLPLLPDSRQSCGCFAPSR